MYWHNIQNVHDGIKGHSSYPEPEKKKKLNEERQSTDANAEMSQMLELLYHDLNNITRKTLVKWFLKISGKM